MAIAAMGDQVADILKKVTQQNEEFSKKSSQFEQQMNARDSRASNLGAIGIEGQRMTGNDFMLSAMEDCKTKMYVPEWFETEKLALIYLPGSFQEDSETGSYGKDSDMTQPPRRGIHGSETFLKGMEYLAVAQYMLITLM